MVACCQTSFLVGPLSAYRFLFRIYRPRPEAEIDKDVTDSDMLSEDRQKRCSDKPPKTFFVNHHLVVHK